MYKSTLALSLVGGFFMVSASAQAALVYALGSENQIVRFDSATPQTLASAGFVSGLQAGEELLGIDLRPLNGQLYGVGSLNNIYRIDKTTLAATRVGSGFSPALSGVEFGFDFNPTVDRIRLTSDQDQNLRLHPDLGTAVFTDGTLAYAAGDPNFGRNPNIVGSAYTRNFAGGGTTTLYNIDSELDVLVSQVPPNSGTLNTIGSLGFDTGGMVGFDIQLGSETTAFASLTAPGSSVSQLFSINLATGVATQIGAIGVGDGTLTIRDITVVPEPATMAALGLGVAALLRKRRK